MLLNLYNLIQDRLYLDYFKKNAYFWDTNLVDHAYKEVFQYTSRDGTVKTLLKADPYKSAYHSMENALLNYLYVQLYVHKGAAELYFNLSADSEGVKHYVKIVEDPDVVIKKVEINQQSWEKFDAKEGYVILPQGAGMKVKVVFGVSPCR